MRAARLLILCLFALCGCAATGSGRSPDPGGVAVAESDSLSAVEDVLGETALEELPATLPMPASSPRTDTGPRRIDVSVISGARSQTRCLARVGPISAGFREDGVSRQWHTAYNGSGFVRQILVGNQKVQVGERVIFGRGFGTFPSSSARSVAKGFRATSSLSRWFGIPAVSAVLAAGPFVVSTVMTGVPGAALRGRRSVLASLGFARPGVTMGVTVASNAKRGASESADVPGALGPTLVSLHGEWRDSSARASYECVRTADRRLYGAVRVRHGAPTPWTLFLFRVPVFSSTTIDERSGYRFDAHHRVGRLSADGAFETTVLRRTFNHRLTHRFDAGCTLRTRIHTWEVTARVRRDRESSWPRGVLPGPARLNSEWVARVRSVLRIRSGPWSHLMLLEYFPVKGRADGALLTLATTARSGRLELSGRMSAYHIPKGRVGFISRPGVGTFEFFSSVYGRGSDLSIRARAEVSRAIRLEVYFGTPWGKEARAYAALRLRL